MIGALADRLASTWRRAAERGSAALRTAAARHDATLGPGARLGPHGRVINIRADRNAITIGASSVVDGDLLTFAHGGRITIGDWCFVGRHTAIWSAAEVSIGDRVLISHGVEIHDTDAHPLDAEARFAQTRAILTSGHPRELPGVRSAPVRIGSDVWIGFGAKVFKGVTIGDRAIVGAGAVVRSDVPADGYVKVAADDIVSRRPA